MNEIIITPEDITKRISLKTEDWDHIYSTNCYAYALGLDINEDDICYDAYSIGGLYKKFTKDNTIMELSLEERFYGDMEILNIQCDVVGHNYCIFPSKPYIEGFNIYKDYSWLVAIYGDEKEFHVIRKGTDGKWYHKEGYYNEPKELTRRKTTLIDPKEGIPYNYDYVGTYKLNLKRNLTNYK